MTKNATMICTCYLIKKNSRNKNTEGALTKCPPFLVSTLAEAVQECNEDSLIYFLVKTDSNEQILALQ